MFVAVERRDGVSIRIEAFEAYWTVVRGLLVAVGAASFGAG